MANIDRPNGFRPVQSFEGSPVNLMLRRYKAADRSADATNNHGDIYIGDPVALVAGEIVVANSGDVILGVAVGTGKETNDFGEIGMFNADSLEQRYLAYDEAGYVWVCLGNNVLFEIQTATALSLVPGSVADFNVAAATTHGSRVTSQSNAELVTVVNNDVIVVQNAETPDNDVTLVNARHLVQFTNTIFFS